MDTQTKVSVKALGTIKHGTEGNEPTTYNPGDTIEVTIAEAKQLLDYKVVEVTDEVASKVAQAEEASNAVADQHDALVPEPNVAVNTPPAQQPAEPAQPVVLPEPVVAGEQPSTADIAATLDSVQ